MIDKLVPPGNTGTFIDLFAGCGGLSLGLMQVGWQGLFAIEKEKLAFQTLSHNLISKTEGLSYKWPEWLPQKPMELAELLDDYEKELHGLNQKIDLVVGGPPCQGFSAAGKRNYSDPRNQAYKEYIRAIQILKPRFLLIENVKGIQSSFKNGKTPYSQVIIELLEQEGYKVFSEILAAKDYGIPQLRPRYFAIGVLESAFGEEINTESVYNTEIPS